MSKNFDSYKTIGEVSKILSKYTHDGKSVPAHTIRFWEKEFKQIRPKTFNGNRRYYDLKNIELLKKIYILLKEQGMTISGVKKILNNKEPLKLDEISNRSIRTDIFKSKLIKISKILDDLKKIK